MKSTPTSVEPTPKLTVEDVERLLAEGRKLRLELEERIAPMRVPSFEQRYTRCR
jgi:hypothetical protein